MPAARPFAATLAAILTLLTLTVTYFVAPKAQR